MYITARDSQFTGTHFNANRFADNFAAIDNESTVGRIVYTVRVGAFYDAAIDSDDRAVTIAVGEDSISVAFDSAAVDSQTCVNLPELVIFGVSVIIWYRPNAYSVSTFDNTAALAIVNGQIPILSNGNSPGSGLDFMTVEINHDISVDSQSDTICGAVCAVQ